MTETEFTLDAMASQARGEALSLEQRLEAEEELDEEYCDNCSELIDDCSCDDEDDEDEQY